MTASNQIHREMTSAMRDLLGSGFVPEYYEQMAGDFVSIAEWYVEQASKQNQEKIDRLEELLVHEEKRTAEANERLEARWRDEEDHPLKRDRYYRIASIITTRDVRAALNNDQATLDKYWERQAVMDRLREENERGEHDDFTVL